MLHTMSHDAEYFVGAAQPLNSTCRSRSTNRPQPNRRRQVLILLGRSSHRWRYRRKRSLRSPRFKVLNRRQQALSLPVQSLHPWLYRRRQSLRPHSKVPNHGRQPLRCPWVKASYLRRRLVHCSQLKAQQPWRSPLQIQWYRSRPFQ